MKNVLNRKSENCVYIGVWAVVASVWLLDVMRGRIYTDQPLVDGQTLWRMLTRLWPFVALFLTNNLLLVPKLLLRNRNTAYFLSAGVVIMAVWGCQVLMFRPHPPMPLPPHPHPMPKPFFALPMPLFLDFVYDLLVVGVNIAVALIFQRARDGFERQTLLKADAESRLSYLKAQINPHFYMNMLNNIHGMIEINPSKAQDMVLDMSHLMRYMLYESSRPMIALSAEIDFLRDYLRIMRVRYPENKVKISASLPTPSTIAGIKVPPLLYLVYIENAFKHGISFDGESYVAVSLEVSGDEVRFTCLNSRHSVPDGKPSGIGLQNARQRLKLIYGSRYELDVHSDVSSYTVHLTIPAHENTDTDN